MRPSCSWAVWALFITSHSLAQPVIDGTADASYGPALSIQNTRTQYGDNDLGDLIATRSGGSEIDQVFGTIRDGRLYVAITGNLENNFNKLQVFIDSTPGGVNTISGLNLPVAVDAFCCGGFGTTDGALQRLDPLTFDAGFNADYYLTFTHGREGVGPDVGGGNRELNFWALSAHYADLTQGTSGAVVSAGIQLAPEGRPNVLRANGAAGTFAEPAFVPTAGSFATNPTTSLIGPALPGLAQGELIDKNYALAVGKGDCDDNTGAGCLAKELEFALPPADAANERNHRNLENTIDLRMALNNVNIEGVSGSGGPDFALVPEDDPANVRTGLEFSIPLAKIGNPTGPVRITAFVGGTGHDHTSNQFSGVGILSSNVGSFPPDLSFYDGEQFVTVPVAAGVPGDYNANGVVDAADYTRWRDTVGTSTTLPNDTTPGTVSTADYEVWRARFGATSGSGSTVVPTSAVPESSSLAFVCLAALLAGRCRWQSRERVAG